MSKSVYSLVLTDEVVAAVDSLACKKGWSRSNMIDSILAEHLSFDTADKRMRVIFDEMEKMITSHRTLRFTNMASHCMASISSSLPYRYKPTVKYSLELYESGSETGRLKVTLRTRNERLMQEMDDFFRLFCGIERRYLNITPSAAYGGGKFERVLTNCGERDASSVAASVTAYVAAVDKMLTYWFASGRDGGAVAQLESMYVEYLSSDAAV